MSDQERLLALAMLVRQMREAQQAYFRKRGSLEAARSLEKQVDSMVFDIIEGQKELFPPEDV